MKNFRKPSANTKNDTTTRVIAAQATNGTHGVKWMVEPISLKNIVHECTFSKSWYSTGLYSKPRDIIHLALCETYIPIIDNCPNRNIFLAKSIMTCTINSAVVNGR